MTRRPFWRVIVWGEKKPAAGSLPFGVASAGLSRAVILLPWWISA